MAIIQSHCNKNIAGVNETVFATLPNEDQSFLRLLDSLGTTLDELHAKITKDSK